MPQLDLTGFLTQLSWGVIILLITFFVIYMLILPDVLRTLRIRSHLINQFKNNNETLNKNPLKQQLQEDLSDIIIELIKLNDNRSKVTDAYILKQNDYNIEINKGVSKKKLLNMTRATKQLKQQFSFVGVLASLISPTDEFILLFCFILFFVIFSYNINSYIADNLDGKISEIYSRFSALIDLQNSFSSIQLDTLKAISGLEDDKRKVALIVLCNLDNYTKLSVEALYSIKIRNTTSNLETKLSVDQIDQLQQNLRVYFEPKRLNWVHGDSLLGYKVLPLNMTDPTTRNALILEELTGLMENDSFNE